MIPDDEAAHRKIKLAVTATKTWASMVAGIAERSKPLKAFLLVNENEEVVKAFQHDDELAQSMIDTLQKTRS